MPNHKCFKWVVALCIVTVLLPVAVYADSGIRRSRIEGTVRVSFYGLGDGYLGKRHAASHWGQTPDNWPGVVDLVHYGIATSDWTIPFGTELCFEVISYPLWSEGEFADHVGTVACGIVVDRMAWEVRWHYGTSIDAWPALAYAAMGPSFGRIGTVRARIVLKGSDDKSERARLVGSIFR